MNQKLTKLVTQLEYFEWLYEDDPSKIFFLLLLLLQDEPLSDSEVENLIADIGYSFHSHGEKSKIDSMLKKLRALRRETKLNQEFHDLIASRVSTLIRTPAILEYIRKSKQIDNNIIGI